jgi:hypothetical protein
LFPEFINATPQGCGFANRTIVRVPTMFTDNPRLGKVRRFQVIPHSALRVIA